VIDYCKRLWAFRCATLRTPGRIGGLHRAMRFGAVAVWAILFICAHGAGAATTPSANPGDLPTAVPSNQSATPNAATQPFAIPDLAAAVPSQTPPAVSIPTAPQNPAVPGGSSSSGSNGTAAIGIDLGNQLNKPSNSVIIIVALTLLSLAPSILVMMTSFTRIVIVLGLTRNAVGVQSIPPNQVVVGLALFLSLFVMAPTLSKMNEQGLQPLLKGQISQSEAVTRASVPLQDFMLRNTRRAELQMMVTASGESKPATPKSVSFTTLVPAFVLSELKTAFIIGFVIFIPFLVIDLVVSAILMALGMMMLPPAFVALPFKLLLFVMVDGWSLVAKSLVESFR
jgi:flagellar biosynthetic protein FliP